MLEALDPARPEAGRALNILVIKANEFAFLLESACVGFPLLIAESKLVRWLILGPVGRGVLGRRGTDPVGTPAL